MKRILLSMGLIMILCPVLLSQNIWVLNNGDPDVQNPPFRDSLKVFLSDGTRLMSKGGFNIDQTLSGIRRIAVTQDGQKCWVTSSVIDSLFKIDINGNILLGISKQIGAIDVDQNGLIYTLTDPSGTIYGDSVLVMNDAGNILNGADYGGFDIAVDSDHGSVWIVGADIKRLDLNLNHQFTIDPVAWTALSVDYDLDGTAWIGEGHYPGNPASKNLLLHVDLNGTILDSIDLTNWPLCVRVDRGSGTVWISCDSLYKYMPSQSQLEGIDLLFGHSLSIDHYNNLVWVATDTDVRSYTKDGVFQKSITNFTGTDQKWVATSNVPSTHVMKSEYTLPASMVLEQNYPNPFNPRTTIKFSLPHSEFVTLEIYDISGKKITTLISQNVTKGVHTIEWDGGEYASGNYFCRLKTKRWTLSKKLVLLK
jgi:hypothetical protein